MERKAEALIIARVKIANINKTLVKTLANMGINFKRVVYDFFNIDSRGNKDYSFNDGLFTLRNRSTITEKEYIAFIEHIMKAYK